MVFNKIGEYLKELYKIYIRELKILKYKLLRKLKKKLKIKNLSIGNNLTQLYNINIKSWKVYRVRVKIKSYLNL